MGNRKRNNSPGVKDVRFHRFGFLSRRLKFMLHSSRKGPVFKYYTQSSLYYYTTLSVSSMITHTHLEYRFWTDVILFHNYDYN